jgi:hypothetical protein
MKKPVFLDINGSKVTVAEQKSAVFGLVLNVFVLLGGYSGLGRRGKEEKAQGREGGSKGLVGCWRRIGV